MNMTTETMSPYISKEEWYQLDEHERELIISAIDKDYRKNEDRSSSDITLRKSFYIKYGKRIIDIFISGIALLITLPINLIIMVVTVFDVGVPIIFRQERIGKDGRSFFLYKFRNMTNKTNDNGVLLPPSERVTKWGKFVRKTSLDELLNFWSIFKGDMSLIGPRPMPEQYRSRFSSFHKQRHLVRPGLECPFHDAKLRSEGWQGRFENDIWYVENISFATDVKLMFLLVKKVFSRTERSASAVGEIGEFIGYRADGTVIDEFQIPREYLRCIHNEVVQKG